MKTCHDVRKERLATLVKEQGGVRVIADLIVKSETQIRQWLNASKDSRTGKPRGISDDMARFIEERTAKEAGWLDNDPELVYLPQWHLLTELERASVIGFINGILAGKQPAAAGRFVEEGSSQPATPRSNSGHSREEVHHLPAKRRR